MDIEMEKKINEDIKRMYKLQRKYMTENHSELCPVSIGILNEVKGRPHIYGISNANNWDTECNYGILNNRDEIINDCKCECICQKK